MSTGVRVAAFAALLALIFAAAALAGRALDPGTASRHEHGAGSQQHVHGGGQAPAPAGPTAEQDYRQFRHRGRVHTVALTRKVAP